MRKGGIPNRLAGEADLLTELNPLHSLVEIYGNQRVLVENHQGVHEYTSHKILVCAKCGNICVEGTGLRIALMTKNRLVIQGRICNIALNKEG